MAVFYRHSLRLFSFGLRSLSDVLLSCESTMQEKMAMKGVWGMLYVPSSVRASEAQGRVFRVSPLHRQQTPSLSLSYPATPPPSPRTSFSRRS